MEETGKTILVIIIALLIVFLIDFIFSRGADYDLFYGINMVCNLRTTDLPGILFLI